MFRDVAIVMEEYDGFSNIHAYKLDKIPIWARIQGVPEGLMKKRELAEKVVKKVGDPITVVVSEGRINPTPYLRATVWLDLKKPLVRVVPIVLKERMKYLLQYERLPAFCFSVVVWGMKSLNVAMEFTTRKFVSGGTGCVSRSYQ